MQSLDAVVALRNQVQAAGIAKLLQSLDLTHETFEDNLPAAVARAQRAPGTVLVVAVRDVAEAAGALLARTTADGLKLLALVDDDLTALGRLAGVRCSGVAATDSLGPDALDAAFRDIRADRVHMPPAMAAFLLSMASEGLDRDATRVRLTPREEQALGLLVDGLSNKQIARRLGISGHGAKRLVANILAKLDVPNRTMAVAKALRGPDPVRW